MISKRVLEDRIRWGTSGNVPAVVQDYEDGRVLMLAYVDAEALAMTLATGDVHFHSRSRNRLWRKGETSGNVLHLRDIALDCDGDALLLTVQPTGPVCHRGTRSCFDLEPLRDDDAGEAPEESEPPPIAAPVAPAPPEAVALAPAALADPGPAPQPLATPDLLGLLRTPVTPAVSEPERPPTPEPEREPAAAAEPLPAAGQGFAWLETLWATIESRSSADPAVSYTARLVAGGVDAPARKVGEEAVEVVMAAKDDAIAEPDRRADTQDALANEIADLLYHTLVLLRERGLEPAEVIARLRARHKP